MQSARRDVIHRPQFVHHGADDILLGGRGITEAAQHRALGIANIADSAGTAGIFHIAKMPHQLRHTARARIRECNHLLELFGAVQGLNGVCFLPT